MAEKLHKTLAELRTGIPQPLSCAEFTYWLAFETYKHAMREMNGG